MAGAAIIGGLGAAATLISGERAAGEARSARREAGVQQEASLAQYEEAAQRLEELGIPPAEAQRIILESPELVGLQEIRELGPSQFEEIETDPRLRRAQLDALGRLEEFGGAGLTEAEKAQSFLMQRQVAGEEQARQKSILQGMAERGVSGSGIELAARLGSSQASAERRAMSQAQLAGQAQQRALQAITQGAGLAGQVRGQEFGEAAQTASAADRIAQFNIQQRAQIEAANLAREQNIEQQRAAAAQQQEISNKALIQQEFQNRLAQAQAAAASRTGAGQAQMAQAGQTLQAGQAAAAGQLQQGAALAGLIGQVGGSYLQGQKPTAQPAPQPTPQPSFQAPASNIPDDKFFNVAKDGGLMKKYKYQDGGPIPLSDQQSPMGNGSSPHISSPNSNGGFAGGGIPIPDASGESEEDRYLKGDIIPGEDFEGDRVDAKVNSGEMVLNIEQQQRLMELLKGLRGLQDLGDEDIVESADKFQPVEPDLNDFRYGGPGTRAPEEVRAGLADNAPTLEDLLLKDGGVIHKGEMNYEPEEPYKGEYNKASEDQREHHTKDYGELARGLTQEYSKMNEQNDKMKEAQKNTGARIKALETLMGIEKRKK